jgi:hypothetical protein
MKSTELIYEIIDKFGKRDKKILYLMLKRLRIQIKYEVKNKVNLSLKEIDKLYEDRIN